MPDLIVKTYKSPQPYNLIWQEMKQHIDNRQEKDPDQIWLLQHKPVFTLGQAGLAEHIIDAGSIPIIRSDRGGQVTYHGPGQLMLYTLFNLKRLNCGIKSLVCGLEQATINCLEELGLNSQRSPGRPGVYYKSEKIAAIGLRIRRGYSYHGLALNINPDTTAFSRINPCGYADLKTTSIAKHIPEPCFAGISAQLVAQLQRQFKLQLLNQNLNISAET